MKISVNEAFVQGAHEEVFADAQTRNAGDRFLRMSKRYVEGHWKRFIPKVELFSRPLRDATFVDYGCKFGHLTPLLIDQGVKKIYSIDVEDEHLSDGEKFFGSRFPSTYIKSDRCYVDVPSSSADFILVNEVISHINPRFLDTFYAEVARILKPDGELIISDGNNWSHLQTRLDLLEWYSLWEHGVSKEFGDKNYTRQRKDMIRSKFPDLGENDVEYLAANTSGLYGDQIYAAVESYRSGGKFIERPHRAGVSPTHPRVGVVMERAFDPRQVLIALEMNGVDGVQILRGHELHDDFERGATKNFTIRGRKIPETVDALSAYARKKLAPRVDNSSGQLSEEDVELIGVAKYLAGLHLSKGVQKDWLDQQSKSVEKELRLRRRMAELADKPTAVRAFVAAQRILQSPSGTRGQVVSLYNHRLLVLPKKILRSVFRYGRQGKRVPN